MIIGVSVGLSGFSSEAAAQSATASTSSSAVPPGAVIVAQTDDTTGISPETRILPKHLYERRRTLKPVKTPKGYRPAWQDGRMNPRRAEGTLRGEEEMNLIWTQTVPRRLIVSQ